MAAPVEDVAGISKQWPDDTIDKIGATKKVDDDGDEEPGVFR